MTGELPASSGNSPLNPPSPAPVTARRSSMRAVPATGTCSGASPARLPARRSSPGGRCACGAATPTHASRSPPPWTCCKPIPTRTRCWPWSNSARWKCSPAPRCGPAHHRGAHPRPGPRRRHRPAHRPVHVPRDMPFHDGAAARRIAYIAGSCPARHAGRRQHARRSKPAEPVGGTGSHRSGSRGGGRPLRRRTFAPGRRAGTSWPTRPGTWSRPCCCSVSGTPPSRSSRRRRTPTGWAISRYSWPTSGWLAALRGDTGTAEAVLAALRDLRASEDPQDKAMIAIVEAFTAAARLAA